MTLYTAGLALSTEGAGTFVVLEKVPRDTGRTRELRDEGGTYREPVWEYLFRVVGIEHLTMTLPAIAARVADRLQREPLAGDTRLRVDAGAFGRSLLRLFHERGAYPSAVVIGGEKESTDAHGTKVLPVSVLQATATLMLETDRLEVASGLVDGPALLHSIGSLQSLPPSGPARDLGIAAAIALHADAAHVGNAWPSNKPKPPAMVEAEAQRAWKRQALAEAVRSVRGNDW